MGLEKGEGEFNLIPLGTLGRVINQLSLSLQNISVEPFVSAQRAVWTQVMSPESSFSKSGHYVQSLSKRFTVMRKK